uniref:Tetrachloroethene reductive dehalogenase A n=1 Tax=uncultured Geobacter sp. TaxID=186741 RepID=A0A2Z5WKS8_9BACT|nr:tetrachloroethene reductive dehalogenase A [uncultured Geobacter sp.]
MDRRDFFKKAALISVVAGAAVISSPLKSSARLVLSKEQDEFPYEISSDFKGMPQTNCIFCRVFSDKDAVVDEYVQKTYGLTKIDQMGVKLQSSLDGFVHPEQHGEPGFTAVDKALELAGFATNDEFSPYAQFGRRNSLIGTHIVNPVTGKIAKDKPVFVPGFHTWDNSRAEYEIKHGDGRYQFKDKQEATDRIKRACSYLGADLVGVTSIERAQKWVYTNWIDLHPIKNTFPDGTVKMMTYDAMEAQKGNFISAGYGVSPPDFRAESGFEPKSVITLAWAMDYDAMKTAPSLVAGAAAGEGYSRLAEISYKVSTFLRRLGIKCAPCGNDTAASIPIAIESGMGEGGRMGMLITEKYGPNVRLAKIFTDIELVPDKPRTFGVKDFCKNCKKCADACPAKAICKDPAQVYKVGQETSVGKINKSHLAGVERYYVNAERCFGYWAATGTTCGTCVAVCPYNKIDEWHHNLTKIATLTPFKPLLRDLDELFGYGGPLDKTRPKSKWFKDAVADFWNKA